MKNGTSGTGQKGAGAGVCFASSYSKIYTKQQEGEKKCAHSDRNDDAQKKVQNLRSKTHQSNSSLRSGNIKQ